MRRAVRPREGDPIPKRKRKGATGEQLWPGLGLDLYEVRKRELVLGGAKRKLEKGRP